MATANVPTVTLRPRRRWLSQWSLRALFVFVALAAVASWWLRGEKVAEQRRRELIAASNEPGAKVVLFQGNVVGLVVTSWKRILGAFLSGHAPAGPVQGIRVEAGYNPDEVLEALALFPEATGISFVKADIDPKLYPALQRFSPDFKGDAANSGFMAVFMRLSKEPELGMLPKDDADLDALFQQLANNNVPLKRLIWDPSQVSRTGWSDAGRIRSLQRATCTDVDDASMASFRDHPRLLELHVLKSPDCTDETADIIASMPNLLAVQLDGTRITDKGLLQIGGLPYLSDFTWTGASISPEGLDRVGYRRSIVGVTLASPDLNDKHLAVLAKWPKLARLTLTGGSFSREALAKLDGHTFESVRLRNCKIDDEGFSALKKAVLSVRSLDINCPTITDQGVAWLTELTGPAHVSLRGSGVSSKTIEDFATWKGLESIEAGGKNFDETWMPAIAKWKGLKRLSLGGSEVDNQKLLSDSSNSVQYLTLMNTAVTVDAIPRLLEKWPLLEFITLNHDYGTKPSITDDDIRKLQQAHPGVIFSQSDAAEWQNAQGRRLFIRIREWKPHEMDSWE